MADIAFPTHAKSLTTSTGNTYHYVRIPARSAQKPTLLLLHGFPSSSYDWRHQITFLSSQGYGIIAPDLLGYGSTSRPSDLAAYTGKRMAREIADVLDAEGFDGGSSTSEEEEGAGAGKVGGKKRTVHGISHDWGVFLMSRLANYFPERFASVTFMSVAYQVPGGKLDVDAFNALTKQVVGFEVFGYWKFFDRQDAGDVVRDHFDSFYSIIYTANPKDWVTDFSPLGKLEAFLKADKTVKIAPYITEEDKQTYAKIMNYNFSPAMNWYRTGMSGLNQEDDAAASPPLDPKLHVPVLYVESSHDPLSGGERVIQSMQAVLPDFTVKKVPSGHWLQLEKPDEVNKILEEFVESVEARK